MRIVVDLQGAQSASRFRGIGRYTLSLARAIASEAQSRDGRHEVVFALNGNLPATRAIRSAFADLVPASQFAVFEIPSPVAEHDGGNSWRARSAELLREQFLADLRPDIVHVSSLFEGFVDDAVVSIGMSGSSLPNTATLYDLVPLLRPETYLNHPSLRAYYMRKLQSLKRAETLLAISASSGQEAITALHVPPERIVTISAGIDPSFRRLTFTHDEATRLRRQYGLERPFVLYAGAADPRKNVGALLDAFRRLPPALQDTHCLAVAGELDEREQQMLASSASSLPPGALVMTGYVPDADLVALYNLCAVLAYPSLHEGFGFPVAEAMACGAAVIASDRTSLPEIVGRQDALFDPEKPETIAALMARVLSDDGFRKDLRSTGPERVRHFTWEESGRRAVDAFEHAHERRLSRGVTVPGYRPRLAVVAPLPPELSGVAHYTADYLPELAKYYEVVCIVTQAIVDDDWVLANFAVHDLAWFEANADSFDRVLYQFGNSPVHAHMFDLLARVPGVVMLHDFYLSSVLRWMGTHGADGHVFDRAVYRSHGLTGLLAERARQGRGDVEPLPCSGDVIAMADGVLVHSRHAIDLARSWYGEAAARRLWHVPFFRTPKSRTGREAARARLHIGEDEFVVCSFGWVSVTKLNHRLLDAWVASGLHREPSCRLIFIGENDGGAYGGKLQQDIDRIGEGRARITGFVRGPVYDDHLAAADAAVQLRSRSRGETSAAIFDCLQQGIPLIVNAHGSAAELPADMLLRLSDEFTDDELRDALLQLYRDRPRAHALATRSLDHARKVFAPAIVARRCRDAIEAIALGAGPAERRMRQRLEALVAERRIGDADAARIKDCMELNRTRAMAGRLLYDVTALSSNDLRSGIERVTRSLLAALVEAPPPGMHVEPVRATAQGYVHAHAYARASFDLPWSAPDTPVYPRANDVLLNTEWTPSILDDQRAWITHAQARGLTYIQMVHDLLPVQHPGLFPEGIGALFSDWLVTVSDIADRIVCVSRTTEAVLRGWLGRQATGQAAQKIMVCTHGADLGGSPATVGLPADADRIIGVMNKRPAFLMVGTIEPRKGHRQALEAFEHLWAQGVDVSLIVVGRAGWNVEDVSRRLSEKPEAGRRLLWLRDVSDEMLQHVYRNATALLAASLDEGYGLPIIEAALHDVPVLARDIPVFREVAGEHATYFQGEDRLALADAIRDWLDKERRGALRTSFSTQIRTWKQCATELGCMITGQEDRGAAH